MKKLLIVLEKGQVHSLMCDESGVKLEISVIDWDRIDGLSDENEYYYQVNRANDLIKECKHLIVANNTEQ